MKRELKVKDWIENLRSGKFKQCTGSLFQYEFDELKQIIENSEGYCCLGVLCSIRGSDNYRLEGYDFIESSLVITSKIELPEELIGEKHLPTLLASMNDGFTFKKYKETTENTSYVFSDKINNYFSHEGQLMSYRCTFEEIADFLETNFEIVE